MTPNAPPPNEEGTPLGTRVVLGGASYCFAPNIAWPQAQPYWHGATKELRPALDHIHSLTQQLAAARAETERLRAANAKLRWEVRDAQENAWLIYRAKLVDPPNAPPAAKETNDE